MMKTDKESKLERRLQDTISNIKKMQESVVDMEIIRTSRFA